MFSHVLALLRKWGMIGLVKRCMWGMVWELLSLLGRPRKRWIYSVNEKNGFDVRQERRMVHDRSE